MYEWPNEGDPVYFSSMDKTFPAIALPSHAHHVVLATQKVNCARSEYLVLFLSFAPVVNFNPHLLSSYLTKRIGYIRLYRAPPLHRPVF